jgi:hypothetical protein
VIQGLQYFLEVFIDNIYIPVLREFLEDCYDQLQPEQINHILTEEGEKAWEGDILDVYNAQIDIDVLAGANLMAKQAAAQLAPMIMQLVSAAPVQDSLQVQNKKFDYVEFVEGTLDLMGFDLDTLFPDMTPEDQQRAMMRIQALQQGNAKMALLDKKHQGDMELANEKGTVQAGVAIVRDTVKSHLANAEKMMEAMQTGGGE